jgi:hypothetical protein
MVEHAYNLRYVGGIARKIRVPGQISAKIARPYIKINQSKKKNKKQKRLGVQLKQ